VSKFCNLEEDNEVSELEQLVATANEGQKAIRRLMTTQYGLQVSVTLEDEYVVPPDVNPSVGTEYRFAIKPIPKLEPFTTSNGWIVELKDDRLYIGCTSFLARDVLHTLRSFTAGDCHLELRGHRLSASRYGVVTSFGRLKWADADRILEELEKAGV
jgi:hypothetical protein